MNEPKRRFFSGDSLQQALIQAANHFHLAPEEIAYTSIEKKHGFTKVRRKVMIEVNPDAPRKEKGAAPARPAPIPPATPTAVYSPPPAELQTRRHVESPVLDRPALDRPAAPSRTPEIGVRESRIEPMETLPRAQAETPAERRPAVEREERAGSPDRPAEPARGGEERSREPRAAEPGRSGEGRENRENRENRGGQDRGPRRDSDRRGGPPRGRGDRGGERRDRGPRSGAGPREPRREQPSAASRPAGQSEDRRREPGILAGGGLVTLPDTPRRPSERYPVAEGPHAEAAKTAAELLLRVAGLDLEPRVLQGEDRLEVDLSGPDVDWCFADDGELVLAIEHLLPRLIRSMSGESVLVRVDCDNFQEIREERLRSLAQQMAEEVRRFGKPRTLEPLNPADRRVIHVTLADDPHVITESEGDGYFKRITIRPA
ncbi:MAG TPA: R3H domain-containing nucleic acid-binding protein [Thermoanaerobaculia bacterium]|nr:R3H domain-containing nucleic acid-binding protein [Thermoanaerobaculia bacterium]